MNHDELEILISAYYDGEVTAEERAVAEAHIKECEKCRKYFEGLRQISSTLQNWPDETLSPDVIQRVHKKIVGQTKEGVKMKNVYSKVSISIATFVIVASLGLIMTQTHLQRQLQGRIRSSVDDIGSQYAPSQTQQYEPYYLKTDYKVEQNVPSQPMPPAVAASQSQMYQGRQEAEAGKIAMKRSVGGFQSQVVSGTTMGMGVAQPSYPQSQPQTIEFWGAANPNVASDERVVCTGANCYPYPSPVIYYPQPPVSNTEQYDYIQENQFLDATQNPLSTLSIDVDTASYSNVRRFLNQNQLPPADAVRIEELINYFTYDYPQPNWGKPFSITTEVSRCPWNPQHELVLLGIQGKILQNHQIPPSNLVFLIDVSGSMADANKLPLVKEGFKMLANSLRSQDRVSIVVYAGAAGVVLDSTAGSFKYDIMSALDRLQAGGSTAGGQGIQLAYQIAQKNFIHNGNNRVILATDGDFNVGVSSDNDLVRLIEEKRNEGIFLSVLGFGIGNYKDSKIEKLADKGNGNYAYIDNINEARKVMVTELGSMLFTIAKDVKIQIEFNPKEAKAYRLIGYENRLMAKEDFNDDTKDAGELGAGHTVTALYEVIPAGSFAFEPPQGNVDPLKYQTTKVRGSNDLMTVKLRYKEPRSHNSQLITKEVNRQWMVWGPTSSNFQFASAVAEFGLLLRNSQYKGNASYQNVYNRAQQAIGNDTYGYRQEFLGLVQKAQALDHRHRVPLYYPQQPWSFPQPTPQEESDPIQFKGQ